MESLAALVATILFGLIAIALVNLVLVVLVRRGKLKLWVGILSNSITGITAIIGINGSWLLGSAPLISTIAGTLMLLIPRTPIAQSHFFTTKAGPIEERNPLEEKKLSDFVALLESSGVINLSKYLDVYGALYEGKDVSFEELGIDSFTVIEISVGFEMKYSAEVSPERIASTQSIMKLFRLFQQEVRTHNWKTQHP